MSCEKHREAGRKAAETRRRAAGQTICRTCGGSGKAIVPVIPAARPLAADPVIVSGVYRPAVQPQWRVVRKERTNAPGVKPARYRFYYDVPKTPTQWEKAIKWIAPDDIAICASLTNMAHQWGRVVGVGDSREVHTLNPFRVSTLTPAWATTWLPAFAIALKATLKVQRIQEAIAA